MGKFQARSVPKGDYDGIRKQIVEVLDQPGYDDGMWTCRMNSSKAPESNNVSLLSLLSLGSAGPVFVRFV